MNLDSLLENLKLSDKDGLFFYRDLEADNTNFLSIRVRETLLLSLKPTAFFCVNNEPLILFFEENRDFENLEKQIWNFNQSPVIFFNISNQWIVKNGFKLLENGRRLDTLTSPERISDFEYFEIITGSSWEKYRSNFEQKNRVDYFLLKNIEEVRSVLINPKLGNLNPKVANSLIGRVIFIRYLIDRKVELNKYQINNKTDFFQILENHEETYNFFTLVKDDFNGNLFPLEYLIDELWVIEKDEVKAYHLSIIIDLLKGNKINKDSSIQVSLFDVYDFSIIPIEFVSNVYEKFIGVENQAGSGAYYTPLFLVNYIQKETVAKYFKNYPNNYNFKALDPACGSGIFLVEALRQIISQYKILNPSYNSTSENYSAYKEKLKSLLTENIFGIDKDDDAISVAIFSLYITLLDNLEPKSIVGFKFPELFGTNFFISDFFNEDNDFNDVLKNHHFQAIFGNPPWKTKHPIKKQLFELYIEKRKANEKSNLEIENREIAEAFLVRISDFKFEQAALVVVSKILYKVSRKKNKKGIFRNYFLNNFLVSQVLELSSVRHQVFGSNVKKSGEDKGTAPASIIFYKKEQNVSMLRKNVITHISIKPNIFFETFRLMVIEKYDIKEISQEVFINEDWVWKVLVYGNVLDYYFIKRFKNHPTIYDLVKIKENFNFGKGISIGGGDKNDIRDHKKIRVSINSKQKGLKPFSIAYTSNFLNDLEYVHRPRKIDLYIAPVLLVGKGISGDFKAKSAISYQDVIYTDAITGIRPFNEKSETTIYTIECLFNSSLFGYFLIETNSSIGIEREQSHDKDDKFSVPLIIDESLTLKKYSDQIRELNIQKENIFFDGNEEYIDSQIKTVEKNIDDFLLNLYEISNQEKSLIDYSNTITIPLLKGSTSQKSHVIRKAKFKAEVFKDYAKVFIEHFSKRFKADNHFFEVEILWSDHIVLMKFKITKEKSTEIDSIVWNSINDKQLITSISKLGFQDLSYNLFLQKDLKGFEEDYFYIAKPNQYKSWHPALAYLDLSEFVEAFFRINVE